MLMLELADEMRAVFPPFPSPKFFPNFTGYDLDKRGFDWYDMYHVLAPSNEPQYVRTISSVR